jgi:hypothetical protein
MKFTLIHGMPIFFLHHLREVIDRAMAHHAVELNRVRLGDLRIAHVAAQGRGEVDAAFAQQRVNFPRVTADVVFAENIHVELRLVGLVVQADDVFEHAVVGEVMAGGLTPFWNRLAKAKATKRWPDNFG